MSGDTDTADFFGKSFTKAGHSSPADEYYKYKLLKEQLSDSGVALSLADLASQKDKLRIRALERIAKIPESSPLFATLQVAYGSDNKYDIADKIATEQYDELYVKQVKSMFEVPKYDVLKMAEETAQEEQKILDRRNDKLEMARGIALSKLSAAELAEQRAREVFNLRNAGRLPTGTKIDSSR